MNRLSTEQMDRLIAAFRARPPQRHGDFAAAAKAASCDPRTARRMWERGPHGGKSLREQIAEEDAAARVRARRSWRALREAEQIEAQEDAIEQRCRELLLARGVREAAIGSVAQLGQLFLDQVLPLLRARVATKARAIAEQLQADTSCADPGALFKETAEVANTLSQALERAVKVADTAVKIGRLAAGEATEIVAVTPSASIDDIRGELEAVQRALGFAEEDRARKGTANGTSTPSA